jgi:uncharacterized protein YndB with AHSA1/START domain
MECELAEPREKVWRALTVPEIVAEWLNPACEPKAPPADALPANDRNSSQASPTPIEYEIVTAERPDLLRYRVREGHDLTVESTVTFELRDSPMGGTRLRIEHDFDQTESSAVLTSCLSMNANAEGIERTFPTRVLDTTAHPSPALRTHRQLRRTMNRRARRARTLCGAYTRIKAAA